MRKNSVWEKSEGPNFNFRCPAETPGYSLMKGNPGQSCGGEGGSYRGRPERKKPPGPEQSWQKKKLKPRDWGVFSVTMNTFAVNHKGSRRDSYERSLRKCCRSRERQEKRFCRQAKKKKTRGREKVQRVDGKQC